MNVLQFADMSDKRMRISAIPASEYEDFKRYCDIAGKVFVDELTSIDYVAYRSQYGRSREDIKVLMLYLEEWDKIKEDSCVEKEEIKKSTIELDSENHADEDAELRESLGEIYVLDEEDVRCNADTEKIGNVLYEENECIISKYEKNITYASALEIDTEILDEIRIDNGLAGMFGVKLSIRSINALYKVGCTTLKELFLYTPEKLAEIKKLGTKSLNEIETAVSTIAEKIKEDCSILIPFARLTQKRTVVRPDVVLKAFMNTVEKNYVDELKLTNYENAYLRKMQLAKEDIGADFCTLLIDESETKQYAKIISDVLYDFYHKTKVVSDTRNYACRCIENLSESVLSFRLSLCIQLYQKQRSTDLDKVWMSCMGDDIAVRDFALISAHIVSGGNNSITFDYKRTMELARQVSNLGKWLSMIDIGGIVSDLLDCTDLKEQRLWDVLQKRAAGMTLEVIALKIGGLTRERVRQIENKALRVIRKRFLASRHNVFGLISVLRDGDSVLKKCEIEETLGEKYTDILWYCLSRKDGEERYLFRHYQNISG